MWMLPQQSVIMTKAVNNICMAISVHIKGNSVTANLLNTIKPTERTIQQPTPLKISALSLCEAAIPTTTIPSKGFDSLPEQKLRL